MNLALALPLAVMLVGVVLYVVAAGKASEAGRIAFFCGLLVSLLNLAGHALRISA